MVMNDERHPMVCTEYAKVSAILSLNYRHATIKLDNGEEVSVNQATLKPGDKYCLRRERKK